MRVCIIGDEGDLSAAYLGWLAGRRDAEVVVLAERDYGVEWTFRLESDPVRGVIDTGKATVGLSEVDGAFVRLNPSPAVPQVLGVPREAEYVYVLERRYALHWLLDEAPFPVVNRPYAGRSNSSKPYQMHLLAAAGFVVPAWIGTNDPVVAADFISACRSGAVCKACSGLRSRVRRAGTKLLERLEDGSAPVVIQEYIPGTDVRVHVVGDRIFGTEVCSEGLDYRFDTQNNAYQVIDPPSEIADLCGRFAASEGLLLAGFDFRQACDRRWWCLEMNPVPTFLPYEAATGQPIGDAILDVFGLPRRLSESVSPLFGLAQTTGGERPFYNGRARAQGGT